MGSFVFTWPNAAEEVYVTGTFDNWSKSVKLDKVGDVFQKDVVLSDASKKIYYKFVVDGAWVTDSAAPKEKDEGGNDNNVLTPENIIAAPASATFLSSVTPESTTAQLAKDVPLEEKKAEKPEQPSTSEETSTSSEITAPVAAVATGGTAAAAAATTISVVKSTVGDAKMSDKAADLPGAFPETPASELNKEVKLINPLPAAPGGVNPVKLAPGEKIPESLKSGDINANVKLDPESYEKADAAIASSISEDQLPPVSKNLIPESSLPIVGGNDATISSVAPTSTTVALAAAVPLEKDKATAAAVTAETNSVPKVVKESQEAAGVAPEASAVPEEVKEKEQVEEELLKKVPEAPATSEGTTAATTTASDVKSSAAGLVGGVTAVAAGLGAAAIATATSAKDKAVEQASPAYEKATTVIGGAATKLPVSVKQVLPTSVQEQIATTASTSEQPVSSDVPAEVKESIQEAGTSPEAAANATAVEEKKTVEAELLEKAKPTSSAVADSTAATATPSAAPAAAGATAALNSEAAPAAVNGKDATAATAAAPGAAVAAPAAAIAAAAAAVSHSTAPATPSKATGSTPASKPASPATAEKKKKHRISGFFHKIFDKLDGDKK